MGTARIQWQLFTSSARPAGYTTSIWGIGLELKMYFFAQDKKTISLETFYECFMTNLPISSDFTIRILRTERRVKQILQHAMILNYCTK